MSHSHHIDVPRGPLLGAGALIACVLLTVAVVRLAGVDIRQASAAPVVAERTLSFSDRPDGGVDVHDRAGLVQGFAPGTEGFLRGTLRAVARERRLAGLAPQAPLLLEAHADGRLTLRDPESGARVDLESFGPTNTAVFARLLAPAGTAR